ncbi:unnamed protein product [Symbiodinium pilosum]|uniref:Uncharacterized protein n=1 Tax=Symbiodinium pilosum TaxID=2952 RepID=A0A812NZ67_SYMPI|nr:unnamed protein product [Symbiodinium pilosum]
MKKPDEDDFGVPDDVPAFSSAGSTRGSRSGRQGQSKASSSAGAEKLKLCAYHDCDLDCKAGRRHCAHHHRHLDNCRNQVLKVKGPEACKKWVERCKDIEFANTQVEYMAKLSISLPMFAHNPLIDFVQWEQKFGVLVERKEAAVTKPFEETQWVIEQVNVYGRDKKEMQDEWKVKIAGPWKRDNNGYKGALRLWLPAGEYEETGTTQFAQGSSTETSKGKKAPKASEVEAFRAHAMEVGFDLSHPFFNGGGHESGVLEPEEIGHDQPAGSGGDDPADQRVSSTQSTPTKPTLKRKGASDKLDASEEEGEVDAKSRKSTASGKKRKTSNIASQRAAMFDSLSKQLALKSTSIKTKIEEAKTAQAKEKQSPPPRNATDQTTRKLYNEALLKCLTLGKAWFSASDVSAEVSEHNKQMEAQNEGDKKVDINAKDTLPEQCPASLKKCATDVTKHIAGLAAAVEREEKKRKEKEQKDAEAKHLEQSRAKLKQAQADGAGMAAVFKLGTDGVQAMKILESNSISSDADLSLPFVLRKSSHLQAWTSQPILLQTMTNFGARYKKTAGFDVTGKVTMPYVARAGKEVTEKFFADVVSPVQEKIVDISEFAPGWMGTSWMYGLSPKTSFAGLSPNSAAFLKVLLYGELDMYCLGVADVLDAFKSAKLSIPKTSAELEQALEALDESSWKSLGVKPFHHKLVREDIVYVPTGHVLLERTGASTMIYGARKSFIVAGESAIKNYGACVTLQEKEGKNVVKMKQVVEALSKHGQNAEK